MNRTGGKEIITFKGSRQGVLMSIIEDEPFDTVMDSLKYKFDANRDFFGNAPISLDLGWRDVEDEDLDQLLDFFQSKKVNLLGIISSSTNTRQICEQRGLKVIIGRLGLADHHGKTRWTRRRQAKKSETANRSFKTREMKTGEDTLMIKKTIRSGQKVEHEGNLVIMGDVNPGAEVRAGQDLIVLGALRGLAHAGYRAKNGESSIIALRFQPTQVRIRDKMVNKFDRKIVRSKQPVIAKLKNGKIEFKIYS